MKIPHRIDQPSQQPSLFIAATKMNRFKFVGLALSLLICGCFGSASETSVNGILTIDGQPMENVLVTFHPAADPDAKKLIASGTTNADGEFSLKRDGGDESSLAVGSYSVTLTEGAIPDSIAVSKDPLAAQTYLLSLGHRPLPVVYGRHVDTPLKVDVVGGKTSYALAIQKQN